MFEWLAVWVQILSKKHMNVNHFSSKIAKSDEDLGIFSNCVNTVISERFLRPLLEIYSELVSKKNKDWISVLNWFEAIVNYLPNELRVMSLEKNALDVNLHPFPRDTKEISEFTNFIYESLYSLLTIPELNTLDGDTNCRYSFFNWIQTWMKSTKSFQILIHFV